MALVMCDSWFFMPCNFFLKKWKFWKRFIITLKMFEGGGGGEREEEHRTPECTDEITAGSFLCS